MNKKHSDFLRDIGGCPAAMWHGWMKQAVKTDFRGGTDGVHRSDYAKSNVMILYGGGETNLCNLHHRKLAEFMAGHFWKTHGLVAAVEPAAAVTDAISMGHSYDEEPRLSAMGYSLFSREIFACSIVQQVEINRVDAIIIITGCDKTVAGGMLAASWLKDLPVILIHGGTIRAGCSLAGNSIEIETANEAAGMLAAGKSTRTSTTTYFSIDAFAGRLRRHGDVQYHGGHGIVSGYLDLHKRQYTCHGHRPHVHPSRKTRGGGESRRRARDHDRGWSDYWRCG